MSNKIIALIREKFFSSKTVLFILLLTLVWTTIIFVKAAYKNKQMAEEAAMAELKIVDLQEENKTMADLKQLFENQEFLEKEAKRRLNLKKEGEQVVVVPQDNSVFLDSGEPIIENEIKPENEVVEEELTNLEKWWKYIFD